MAKISNSEINALIRKLEAEIKPTEKELEDFEKNWEPSKEEKLLLKQCKDIQEMENVLLDRRAILLRNYERFKGRLIYGNPERVLVTFKQEAKNKLFKQINTQELKDDLLLSGLSSDFNLEEWLKEAKTKYVKQYAKSKN